MAATPRVLVTGYNIRYPLGGQLMHSLGYLAGLSRLGCEVWYIEESGSWPNSCYDPTNGQMTDDPAYGIESLKALLRPFGLEQNWVYVDEQRHYLNRSAAETLALCRSADLLVTVSSATWLPEFLECRRRVYIDTDPGVTQFQMTAEKAPSLSGFASPHNHHAHYTVGLNIGQSGWPIPTWGLKWRPWLQPTRLHL